MAQTEFYGREDYSPVEWRNRVKAARVKVSLDERLGRTTPDWIVELAEDEIPEVARPSRRTSAA